MKQLSEERSTLKGRYDFGRTRAVAERIKMYSIQVIESIRDYLIGADQSLSMAESVTSGHLQAAMSLATDASKFFHGGITTYNLGQKARHLRVNPIHADSCNSVSQVVADEMAVNVGKLFTSDWAIGVTGYAAPLPEMGVTDVFAFYAIVQHEQVVCRGRVTSDNDSLLDTQLYYTDFILRAFQTYLARRNKAASLRERSVKMLKG